MPTEYDGGVLLLESARQLHGDDDGGGGGGDDDECDFDVDNKAVDFEDGMGWMGLNIEFRWVRNKDDKWRKFQQGRSLSPARSQQSVSNCNFCGMGSIRYFLQSLCPDFSYSVCLLVGLGDCLFSMNALKK